MFPPLPNWTEICLRVDRQGRCLNAAEESVWEAISPERRALFGTLIRLAFRGKAAQFRLIGFGPLKGHCWNWTVRPAREGQAIVAAELICRRLPPAHVFAPHFNPATSASMSEPLPAQQLPEWLPS
ncbi:MAG: hypothetical protein AB7O62_23195 [Pirellulales bacterium]